MNTEFRASFTRDLRKLGDFQAKQRVRRLIEQVELAANLQEISNLKKLKGELNYYRIRVGDYRCGIIVNDDTVTFVRFLHRRDVYRYFP